ncbi:MAG: carbohydrate kinase family protein [Clostridia bacterium]|nr:carbohydrate kinase family protein [Clostridia bacterium]
MNNILVSGLINIEVNAKIKSFPVEYSPVEYPFWGINSGVSGVGVNVCKALNCLGTNSKLISLVGKDLNGLSALEGLKRENISTCNVLDILKSTPQSVILYDDDGRRMINVDLKDVQETEYPLELFDEASRDCRILALCNINFSRPFLKRAKEAGKIIATDVHVVSNIHDEYNKDFMQYADIVFMSNEKLQEPYESFAASVTAEYHNEILVMGLGAEGALLYVKKDKFMGRFNAVKTRKIVNTIGAGDSLFSAFVHFYSISGDPYESLKKAIVFSSYKIGENGAAQGFLSEPELNALYEEVKVQFK